MKCYSCVELTEEIERLKEEIASKDKKIVKLQVHLANTIFQLETNEHTINSLEIELDELTDEVEFLREDY